MIEREREREHAAAYEIMTAPAQNSPCRMSMTPAGTRVAKWAPVEASSIKWYSSTDH